SPQENGCKCRGDWQPASSCGRLSDRALAGRGPLSSVVAVVAVLVHLHAQFLDLAGQGVTAPAQQYGGIPAPAGTVLEGGFYHDPLEDGHRLIQQVADTAGQLLV